MQLSTALIWVLVAATPVLVWYLHGKYRVPTAVVLGSVYVAVFLVMAFFSPEVLGNIRFSFAGRTLAQTGHGAGSAVAALGFRPEDILSSRGLHTSLTSTFLHSGLLHLGGNILFLFLFGAPLEEKIGTKRFLLGYIITGMAAAYMSGFLDLTMGPSAMFHPFKIYFGASGAIAGIMGIYLYLYPRDETYVPLVFIITKAPVYVGVLLYLALETFIAFSNPDDGIGHIAHISGIIAGLGLGAIIGRIGVPERSGGQRKVSSSAADLGQLASSPGSREVLKKIEGEDNPEIIDAWLEKLADIEPCPKCGSKLEAARGRIRCRKCRYSVSAYR